MALFLVLATTGGGASAPPGYSPGTGSPPYTAGTARQLPPDFILIPHADRTVGSEKLILAVRDFRRVLRDLRDGMLPSLKLNGTTVSVTGENALFDRWRTRRLS